MEAMEAMGATGVPTEMVMGSLEVYGSSLKAAGTVETRTTPGRLARLSRNSSQMPTRVSLTAQNGNCQLVTRASTRLPKPKLKLKQPKRVDVLISSTVMTLRANGRNQILRMLVTLRS